MTPSPNIDEIVERLEAALTPRLAEFGSSLMRSNEDVVAETFSHRHAGVVHNLGLRCHPVGSDSFDPRTVGIIVTVTAFKKPSLKAYVAWQSPSFHQEGQTAIYDRFREKDLTLFNKELDGLLPVLAAALRGAPPQKDQPMQRVTAIVGATFVFAVAYFVLLFVVRTITDGLGLWADVTLMIVVGLIALVPAVSSYRASIARDGRRS